jgi:hypothetical protein
LKKNQNEKDNHAISRHSFHVRCFCPKSQVGLTGGASSSNYKFESDEEEDEDGPSKTGFTFGVIANIPAGKNFIVQSGAHWGKKGRRMEKHLA